MCVLVSAPFNMLQLTRHVTFPGSWVCKLFFLVRVILGLSLMIMTTIAVSRFQQICHIFKCPAKTSHLWTFVICYSIVSAISYIPTFFFIFRNFLVFGTAEVYKENITGYKCMKIDTEAWIEGICFF